MIVKKLDIGTYVFEKNAGITAFFSNKEEDMLYEYFNSNIRTEFIDRLFDLGIITKEVQIEKPKLGIALHSLHMDITDSCPLKCPQCYKGEAKRNYMDFKLFKSLIDEAVALSVFQIAIGGGEPLVHKDIASMVECVGNTEMSVSITTSGYGLDEKMLTRLIEAGLNHLQISLNGATKDVNDRSRDGYEYAINALKLLSETSDFSYGINFVVRRDNLDDLQNLINLGKEYKVHNINLLRYKPTSLENYELHELTQLEIDKLLKVVKANRDITIKVDSAYTPFLNLVTDGNTSQNQSGCGALEKFINVTVDGKFKPCSHLDLIESSDSIYEYYTSSNNKKVINDLEYVENAKCTDCKYNKRCEGCLLITKHKCGVLAKGEIDCKMYRRR